MKKTDYETVHPPQPVGFYVAAWFTTQDEQITGTLLSGDCGEALEQAQAIIDDPETQKAHPSCGSSYCKHSCLFHQPHVRPIVRGKSQAKVEFGAKIHVSMIDGISLLDKISWEVLFRCFNLLKITI